MSAKGNFKSEIVLLSALLTAFIQGTLFEKLIFVFMVFCVFFAVDFLKYALREYLSSTFKIPFVLITAATFFQAASFQLEFLEFQKAVFLVMPTFLLLLLQGKWETRVRTVSEYVIFSFFLILIQEITGRAFYLSAFLAAAFGAFILRDLSKSVAEKTL